MTANGTDLPEREAMEFDVVIVGGGGHGLATAYYLAKEFGITNVAVLEKGWLGAGNIGPLVAIIAAGVCGAAAHPLPPFA